MSVDARDFGFKGGDTIRATRLSHGGSAHDGTVAWLPLPDGTRGMCLESDNGQIIGLVALHEAGFTFELVKRPALTRAEQNLAIVLDDPAHQFAFRDGVTQALAITEAAMLKGVGVSFPVIVLPESARAQVMSDPGSKGFTVYDGPLPEAKRQ